MYIWKMGEFICKNTWYITTSLDTMHRHKGFWMFIWKTFSTCRARMSGLVCVNLFSLHVRRIACFCFKCIFFFLSGFSFRDTDDSQDRKGREGTIHFHQLTSIEIFICNFTCEMTITYFYSQCFCLPDCYSIRFTTLSNYHLIDSLMMQCLFVYLMNWF